METTHGWYDGPLEWIRANKSIRPMNINVDYWPMMFSEQDCILTMVLALSI